jgi:hypothetical protein
MTPTPLACFSPSSKIIPAWWSDRYAQGFWIVLITHPFFASLKQLQLTTGV